jgi:apolipoprotein N-acyltransferase
VAVPGLIAIVALIAGSVALWRRPLPGGPAFDVAVIQGNIDQYKKWDAAYEEDIVRSYSTLTREAALKKPALIVWPETAVPGWIPNDPKMTRWLADAARESRAYLLTGAVSRQENQDYNAAFLLSPKGEIVGHYQKEHLVPFGEYVPLRPLLSRCVGVLNDLGSFSAGREVSVISLPEARLGVNICFEGLFPHLVRRFTAQGAQVLVNLTNDGWYRDTAAPEQHFASNVLRAVENRCWVVRAANTGYSGFISLRGEITGRTNLLAPAVLFGRPQPMDGLTFYARHGDVFVGACAVFLLIGLASMGFIHFGVKKKVGPPIDPRGFS